LIDCAVRRQRLIRLEGQHCARKETGQHDDSGRANADAVHLRQGFGDVPRLTKDSDGGTRNQQRHFLEFEQEARENVHA
jgi:hypothetical protein